MKIRNINGTTSSEREREVINLFVHRKMKYIDEKVLELVVKERIGRDFES